MFKRFLPNKILALNDSILSSLFIIMILVTILGLTYALVLSPPDYLQGDSVRIMYVHVPSSFLSLSCFGFIGLASILSLIFKIKFISLMAKSVAPIGCTFTFLAIFTGSLWGKPTWGIWWVWDARLTSMLLLLGIYIVYILCWKLIKNFEKANKVTSIIGIIGLFNLPIIKFSVDWWNTLHQPASVFKMSGPSIHTSMLTPLILMAIAFKAYYIWVLFVRVRCELLTGKLIRDRQRRRKLG